MLAGSLLHPQACGSRSARRTDEPSVCGAQGHPADAFIPNQPGSSSKLPKGGAGVTAPLGGFSPLPSHPPFTVPPPHLLSR